VVVIRSVLIYVAEKRTAFTHLHRVLRPGGRLSLFEPSIASATLSRPTSSGVSTSPGSKRSPSKSRP
jgi:ubiquinone/menaquinone biosynthesis C-methylase UbiE